MNDVLTREIVPSRDLCLAKSERRDASALLIKISSCKSMYGKINSAVSYHLFIGGIYNGVNLHFRYVMSDYLKRHTVLLTVILYARVCALLVDLFL